MTASDGLLFESLLREKLEELDADGREFEDDPLGRFSAAAHRLLLAETGGPMPRPDHGAYANPHTSPVPAPRTLDITS